MAYVAVGKGARMTVESSLTPSNFAVNSSTAASPRFRTSSIIGCTRAVISIVLIMGRRRSLARCSIVMLSTKKVFILTASKGVSGAGAEGDLAISFKDVESRFIEVLFLVALVSGFGLAFPGL